MHTLISSLYLFSHFRYTYGFSTSHSRLPWPMPSWGIPRRVAHAAARKQGSYIQGPAGSQALRPGGEVLTFSDDMRTFLRVVRRRTSPLQ